MPFTCDACGAGRPLTLLPAHDGMLRCTRCGAERPFSRPPLLVVTGASGSGKSTLCARLAGGIPGAVLLDADVFAREMVSVAPPNRDYSAFWRSMARLAHEVSQNGLAVVFFSVMLPEQLLANTDVLPYFESVDFLALTCGPEVLRERLARRCANEADPRTLDDAVARWREFDGELMDAARSLGGIPVVDAGRPHDVVAAEVEDWIRARLPATDVPTAGRRS